MQERILVLLPSLLTLAGFVAISFVYLIQKIQRDGGLAKSPKMKVVLLILSAAVEELLLRAPIIVGFAAISLTAWFGIAISAVLSADLFQKNDLLKMAKHAKAKKSKDPLEGYDPFPMLTRISKVADIILTFAVGGALGYYGIRYQSLLGCAGLHAAWNLIKEPVLTVVSVTVALLMGLGLTLAEKAHNAFRSVFR